MTRIARGRLLTALSALWLATSGCGDSEADKVPVNQEAVKYVDPKGFFSIVPPQGWATEDYLQDPRGKVAFHAPGQDASLRVLAKVVAIPDYDGLMQNLKEIEKELGVSMDIEPVVFNGMPAVKRVASLTVQGVTRRMLWIDILVDGVSHNLQYSSSPSKFDRFFDDAWKAMVTYEPKASQAGSKREAREHEVAKWMRLARLAMEMGKPDAAKQAVEAGLRVDPTNQELKQMKAELDGR